MKAFKWEIPLQKILEISGGRGGVFPKGQKGKMIKGNHEAELELLYQYSYISAKQQQL